MNDMNPEDADTVGLAPVFGPPADYKLAFTQDVMVTFRVELHADPQAIQYDELIQLMTEDPDGLHKVLAEMIGSAMAVGFDATNITSVWSMLTPDTSMPLVVSMKNPEDD